MEKNYVNNVIINQTTKTCTFIKSQFYKHSVFFLI